MIASIRCENPDRAFANRRKRNICKTWKNMRRCRILVERTWRCKSEHMDKGHAIPRIRKWNRRNEIGTKIRKLNGCIWGYVNIQGESN